jgi:hypothetical protein
VAEFATYCANGTALWGRSLCGPLMFVDPTTKTATLGFDPMLHGFARIDNLWSGPLPPGVAIANTSVDIGGRRVAEILLPLPSDPVERRVLLAHESFHRIQPALGFKGREADNGHLDERDARITARLEAAALVRALTVRDWRRAAADALSYRAERLRLYPAARESEGALLANEGLAEYTGVKVGAGADATKIAVSRLESAGSRPSLVRSLGYVVGPAYGQLLDRTGRAWRAAALRGKPLPDLLAAALKLRPRALVASDRYGGAKIVAEETARAAKNAKQKAKLTAELIDGPTVTFPFDKMNIDFNPNTLFALGPAGTVYSGKTNVRDSWGSLTATGDVLLPSDWSYGRVPGPAKVEGQRISGPGWSADLSAGYSAVPAARPGDLIVRKH